MPLQASVSERAGPAPVRPTYSLLAWLIFAKVLDLDPFWVNAGVIFEASPVGLNVYIFARHYNIESASTAILVSTGLAMLTITALLLLLPPAGG